MAHAVVFRIVSRFLFLYISFSFFVFWRDNAAYAQLLIRTMGPHLAVILSVYGRHSFMTSFCKYATNANATETAANREATWAAIKRQAAAATN